MGSVQGCGSWWFTPGINSFLLTWLFVVWFLLCAVRLPLPGPGQAEIPPGASWGLPALHLLPGRSQPPGKGPASGTHTAVWPLPLLRLRPGCAREGNAARGKRFLGLRFLLFLPGVAQWGAALPSPQISRFTAVRALLSSPRSDPFLLLPCPPPLSPFCSSSTCARTFASRQRPRTRGAWGRTSGTSSWTGTR